MTRQAIFQTHATPMLPSTTPQEWTERRCAEMMCARTKWGLRTSLPAISNHAALKQSVLATLAALRNSAQYRNLYAYADPGADWIFYAGSLNAVFARRKTEKLIETVEIHHISGSGRFGFPHSDASYETIERDGHTWQQRRMQHPVATSFITSGSALPD